jgi:hypothetical protein
MSHILASYAAHAANTCTNFDAAAVPQSRAHDSDRGAALARVPTALVVPYRHEMSGMPQDSV